MVRASALWLCLELAQYPPAGQLTCSSRSPPSLLPPPQLYGSDPQLVVDNDDGGEYCLAAQQAQQAAAAVAQLPPEACCHPSAAAGALAAPCALGFQSRLHKVLELGGEAIIRGPGRCTAAGGLPPEACCFPPAGAPAQEHQLQTDYTSVWGY